MIRRPVRWSTNLDDGRTLHFAPGFVLSESPSGPSELYLHRATPLPVSSLRDAVTRAGLPGTVLSAILAEAKHEATQHDRPLMMRLDRAGDVLEVWMAGKSHTWSQIRQTFVAQAFLGRVR